MVPIVKICGLSTADTLDAAISAGADMIGFVFFPRSPRYVSLDRAASLADRARNRADIVVLVVDAEDDVLAKIVEGVRPDWLQLHGAETSERVADIRKRFGIKVMKAIGIGEAADLEAADRYASVSDRLLLDARPTKDALRPGGNAVTFDWGILEGFAPRVSWLLAGGLDAGNVAKALRISHAPGVDVSSGVESAPGVKGVGMIRAFVAEARRTAAARPRERIAP